MVKSKNSRSVVPVETTTSATTKSVETAAAAATTTHDVDMMPPEPIEVETTNFKTSWDPTDSAHNSNNSKQKTVLISPKKSAEEKSLPNRAESIKSELQKRFEEKQKKEEQSASPKKKAN